MEPLQEIGLIHFSDLNDEGEILKKRPSRFLFMYKENLFLTVHRLSTITITIIILLQVLQVSL